MPYQEQLNLLCQLHQKDYHLDLMEAQAECNLCTKKKWLYGKLVHIVIITYPHFSHFLGGLLRC